ncbi:MAG: hypothetical protein JNL58_01565 [Planctomyces sp.]|nr:hypothetical protein [Planctomyces sp.]
MQNLKSHLSSTIEQLEMIRERCLRRRSEVSQIQQDAAKRAGVLHDTLEQLNERHLSILKELEERHHFDFQTQFEQLELEVQQQVHAERTEGDRRLAVSQVKFEESRRELQKALDHELWVIQSICDESGEDTPVFLHSRAEELFDNQLRVVKESLDDLTQRLEQTGQYLQSCHAGTEATLPPHDHDKGNRDHYYQVLEHSSAEAMKAAQEIDSFVVPPWIQGLRMPVIGLILTLVGTVGVAAVRSDLRSFVNPEISKPDWNWLGVSALIAGGTTVLLLTVMLVLTQQKLRSRFARMLQATANARSAAESWESLSRRELQKLDANAQAWLADMTARRERRVEILKASTAENIARLTEEFQTRQADIRSQVAGRTSSLLNQWSQQNEAAEANRAAGLLRLRTEQATELRKKQTQISDDLTANENQRAAAVESVMSGWNEELRHAEDLVRSTRLLAEGLTRWPTLSSGVWQPPRQLPASLPVGDILCSLPAPPADQALEEQNHSCIELPALLRFPQETSLCIEHSADGREAALQLVRSVLLKLLTTIPPGRVQFTLIDPVGLGQSFSAMMHLADFDELLISNRIWTESTQIRERLQKVAEHMENVFQTYLRSEFETIEQYNESAGEVAEPYHFVVVAGFPQAFSEESARHLTSILTSGPRCGVHTLLTWSPDQAAPRTFDVNDLLQHCVRFKVHGGKVVPVTSSPPSGKSGSVSATHPAIEFEPLTSPGSAEYVSVVRAVGEQSRNARRVEVSFTRIAPRTEEIWTHSTADGVNLAIGRAGAARLQFMRLGKGTSQHVLIAGKTGSGKSTLLHILITNLALHYSPSEIQFYLIDFKKGVEFRTYASNHLPHARVVAIESDREFGLSVLERLDEVLQERGDLFRSRGVQDLPSFRRQSPGEEMPRLLLLIDEFQEFFVAEDRVSSRASLLLDRLIRQGRAFGIHVVLGSQTLGGAYSLARSTLGQVAVRIALQCSESDAHLILSEDNSAARLLTRPGEAIYNDANGLLEGNHPFQVAWLDEERREQAITEMLAVSAAKSFSHPGRMVVFEGNVPPAVELCEPLNDWMKMPVHPEVDGIAGVAPELSLWLGEPVAIAAPTTLNLRRATGQNLLIVGQDTSDVDTMLVMSAVACSRRSVVNGTGTRASQLILLHDGRDRESLARLREHFALLPPEATRICGLSECDQVLGELHQLLTQREERGADGELSLVFAVRDIGQFRSLRKEDDEFSLGSFGTPKAATPAGLFADLVRRGSAVGIHVIVWADTFSNAMRWLSNSLLREFENRVAFRMNQTDSASLVDTPVASTLVPGRAILYRDQTGTAEKFRPFAWPTSVWLGSTVAVRGVVVAGNTVSAARDHVTHNVDVQNDGELDIDSFMIE